MPAAIGVTSHAAIGPRSVGRNIKLREPSVMIMLREPSVMLVTVDRNAMFGRASMHAIRRHMGEGANP